MKNGEQYTLRFLFAKENPIIAPWLQDFSVLLAASDDGINMNRMSEMTWQKSKIKNGEAPFKTASGENTRSGVAPS